MLTLTKIFISTVISFFFLSCNVNINNGIDGKGEILTEEIVLTDNFEAVSVSKGWKVELIKAEENKIYISASKNLIPLFKYTLAENHLQIDSKKKINNLQESVIRVYHTKPLIYYSTQSGSQLISKGKVIGENITINTSSGSNLELNIKSKNTNISCSSGSLIILKGTSINLEANASSGSSLEAENLSVKNADLVVSSGANIEIDVKKSIEAKASSGGSITYSGNPSNKKIKKSISGGEISKR